MVWLEQLALIRLEGHAIRVVRDDHFLLADKLEVEAIHLAVENERVVIGRGSGGTRVGRIVGDVRRKLYPSLAGQILPGAATTFGIVEGIDQQQSLARATCRPGVVDADLVVGVRILRVGVPVRKLLHGLATRRKARATRGVDVEGLVLEAVRNAVEAHLVVPHRLESGLRNRERKAAPAARHRYAVVDRCRCGRALRSVVGHELRKGRTAPRRIDIYPVAVVALQQGLGALGQLVGMFRHILGGDRQSRLVVGIRVGPQAAALGVAGGRRGEATRVFGDRARLVTRLLGADQGQRGPELFGLVGTDPRQCSGVKYGGSEGQRDRGLDSHVVLLRKWS